MKIFIRKPLRTSSLLVGLTVGVVIGILTCKDGIYYHE